MTNVPSYPPQQPPGEQPATYPPAPNAKKKRTGKIVAATVGGLALLCCGGAAIAVISGDDRTTTASEPAVEQQAGDSVKPVEKRAAPTEKPGSPFAVKVGSTITHSDDGNTQTAVLRSVRTYQTGCNGLDTKPEQGMYVVVDVVVTQQKGTGSVNPLEFTFVAEDGTTADALSAAFSGCDDPSLDSTNSLRTGQKRAGKIAFDVGMKAGAVEWVPGGLGGSAVGSWSTK